MLVFGDVFSIYSYSFNLKSNPKMLVHLLKSECKQTYVYYILFPNPIGINTNIDRE